MHGISHKLRGWIIPVKLNTDSRRKFGFLITLADRRGVRRILKKQVLRRLPLSMVSSFYTDPRILLLQIFRRLFPHLHLEYMWVKKGSLRNVKNSSRQIRKLLSFKSSWREEVILSLRGRKMAVTAHEDTGVKRVKAASQPSTARLPDWATRKSNLEGHTICYNPLRIPRFLCFTSAILSHN